MLKSLLLLPILGFIAFSQAAYANANTNTKVYCEGLTPDIEIVPTFGHVEQDRSLRAVYLGSKDAWGQFMGDHVDARTYLKSSNTFTVRRPKKGTDVCVVLSHVKILYKLDLTLKLIDDYPKDSCEYKETVAHADRHIAVAKEFLVQTAPILKEYISDNMNGRAGMMIYHSYQDRAEAQLSQTMNNILGNYMHYVQQEHRRFQREVVDVAAERARLSKACPGWKHPHAYK